MIKQYVTTISQCSLGVCVLLPRMGLISSKASSRHKVQSDQENYVWKQLPSLPEHTPTRNHHYIFKFLLIGDSGTGKSQLFSRFVEDSFTETFTPTIGVDFNTKLITIDERRISLQIWDIAGQETFRAITGSFYRGTVGVFIVYDVQNETTLKFGLKKCLEEVKEYGKPDIQLMLLGNKCDLRTEENHDSCVDYLMAKKIADELKIPLFEVSAKDGTNVELAFTQMTAMVWTKLIRNFQTRSEEH